MPTFTRCRVAVFCAVCTIFAASCSRPDGSDRKAGGTDALTAPTETVKPYAAATITDVPTWFEFGPAGPVAVSGPQDSSLTPFEPWPLARRCAGFVVGGGAITAAVARDGFLVVAPRGAGSAALYRAADAERFAPYSVASVFSYRGAPTAVLYRDRFFVDPTESAPDPRAFSVLKAHPEPVPVELPAFAAFPPADGWDVEAFTRAADGKFLLRLSRDGAVSYAETVSQDEASREAGVAAYRAAQLPRPAAEAVGPLRSALEAAAGNLKPREIQVATAVGAEKDFPETFLVFPDANASPEAVLGSSEREVERVWAFYDESRALVLYSDGRYLEKRSADATVRSGKLPELPEGFSYTGAAFAGSLLVAFWEEQDGWAVGSAGFLLVKAAP